MKNFARVLRQAYIEIPERVILNLLYSRQPDQPVTYRGLWQGSVDYAYALSQAGVEPDEVVILILNYGADLAFAFFGAVLRGAIPSIMPFLTEKLSPEHYRASLKALLEITAPVAIITYREFEEEVRQASMGSSVRAVLVSDQNIPGDNREYLGDDAHVLRGLEQAAESIVLLQHSSGTTGLQKGVALSHRAVFNQLDSYRRALHLSPEDVIVSWLPLYHDMGLIAGFLMPILSRVPLVLMSPFDWVRAPYRLLQAISRYRGTLCWLPNFAYNFCAQKIRDRDLQGVDLSSLRAVSNCSEPMYWTSHQAFLERFQPYGLRPQALATCYAMAENVFAVTQGGIDAPVVVDPIDQNALRTRQVAVPVVGDVGGPSITRMLSAGRPIDNTRLRVVNAAGEDLPDRHIGEIVLQSDCMLTGYYRRPDLTEKAFLSGWYCTGDLGYLANGELYVTGRKKDLIIVGGKNIYPQDLEHLACEVPGVHPGRVVVFGVYNEQNGTEDVILVVEADDELQDEEDRLRLANDVRRRVTRGSDIALRHVQVVGRNWLLKTSSGKIARAANREKFLAEFQDKMS